MTRATVAQAIPKVLVICKCPDTGPVWAFSLQQKQIQVVLETSITNAIHRWEQEVPDLIILDTDDSDNTALSLIKELRQETVIPILLLTPRREESYILDAYHAGVDDCIIKPISPAIFIVKVQALLKKCWTAASSILEPLNAGNFRLIPVERLLIKDDEALPRLTNLEFRLMYVLMNPPDRVVPTDELIERVWGYGGEGNHTLLKNVVYRLRRKIEENPGDPEYILTEEGIGYWFAAR